MKRPQDRLGGHLLRDTEYAFQIGQQPNTKARIPFLGLRDKRHSRHPSAHSIRNGNRRFSYVRVTVLNLIRQLFRYLERNGPPMFQSFRECARPAVRECGDGRVQPFRLDGGGAYG
jgi:hypothetical protein